jgi:hypothetical protein
MIDEDEDEDAAWHLPSDWSKNSTALPLSHMMDGRTSKTCSSSVNHMVTFIKH